MEPSTMRPQPSEPQRARTPTLVPQQARNVFLGEAGVPARRALRLAVLLELAPRKLGSMEDWIASTCEEARGRGHQVDVFCHGPIHPRLQARLAEMGAGLETLPALTQAPLAAVARLRRYDVLQLHYFGVRARVPLLAYAAWPAQVLYVDHAGGLPEWEHTPRWRRSAAHVLDRLTVTRLHGVIGVSDYVRDRDRARFGAGERVQTLYNGVSLERFSPVRQPRDGSARFR